MLQITDFVLNPLTRLIEISYKVPSHMPGLVVVACEFSLDRGNTWRPAKVYPLVSESAVMDFPGEEWNAAMTEGRFNEYNATGLNRTVVWNPYPEAQQNDQIKANFRISTFPADGSSDQATAGQILIEADNRDVIYIDDWSRVLQKDSISADLADGEAKWWWRSEQRGTLAPTFGNSLTVKHKGVELPQLTYPLNLTGWYAIYVCMDVGLGGIELRLTGDERTQYFAPIKYGYEVFWKHAEMSRQSLVVKQPYRTVHQLEDEFRAHIDYVKLAPLTEKQAQELQQASTSKREKLLIGYNEPYSWAFFEKVESNLQHREPLLAFAESNFDIVDTQIARIGAKVVFESKVGEPQLSDTLGDPIRGVVPRTGNVGRMQQFTHTLTTQIRYAKQLGFHLHANIGANNCYPGTPLEGRISREHPDWRQGSALKYEIPEVRAYILGLFEEAMYLGAPGISLDFCRYPHGLKSRELVTDFLRELRQLSQRISKKESRQIPFLIRFPAEGVNSWQTKECWKLFDYTVWAEEKLVDILCPSNIVGWPLHFDIKPYVEAVRGTGVKLCPCIDANWFHTPVEFLERASKLYEDGADGIYIYQADKPVRSNVINRRAVALLGDPDRIMEWLAAEKSKNYSKRIYISKPLREGPFHWHERLRVRAEGFEPSELQFVIDGETVQTVDKPPYVLFSDGPLQEPWLSPGEHEVTVRARDGEDWIERTVCIHVE